MWKTGVVWPHCKASRCHGINLWRSFVVLGSRWDFQTCWYHYEVPHSHSHSLTAAEIDPMCCFWMALKIKGKMSGAVWTFLGMLCTLSIAGPFSGEWPQLLPSLLPPLCRIISQHQNDRRLGFCITSCAVICLHLVVGLCHTHRICGFDAYVNDQHWGSSVCWGLSYYHGQGSLCLQIPVILRN